MTGAKAHAACMHLNFSFRNGFFTSLTPPHRQPTSSSKGTFPTPTRSTPRLLPLPYGDDYKPLSVNPLKVLDLIIEAHVDKILCLFWLIHHLTFQFLVATCLLNPIANLQKDASSRTRPRTFPNLRRQRHVPSVRCQRYALPVKSASTIPLLWILYLKTASPVYTFKSLLYNTNSLCYKHSLISLIVLFDQTMKRAVSDDPQSSPTSEKSTTCAVSSPAPYPRFRNKTYSSDSHYNWW